MPKNRKNRKAKRLARLRRAKRQGAHGLGLTEALEAALAQARTTAFDEAIQALTNLRDNVQVKERKVRSADGQTTPSLSRKEKRLARLRAKIEAAQAEVAEATPDTPAPAKGKGK